MIMPGRPDKTWSSQSTWKLAGSPFGSSPAKKVDITDQEKDDDGGAMAGSADEDNNDIETSDNEDTTEAHNGENSADEDNISDPESSNEDKNDIPEAQKDKNETTDEDDSISSTESSSSGSSSSSSSSDATIKPKKRRLVSSTPYTPAFPNLPTGRAWFARQAARGNPVAQPTVPKEKRVPASGARRKKKATSARKPRKEPEEPTRRSKRQKPEAGSETAVNQHVDIAGSGRGPIKRATKTSLGMSYFRYSIVIPHHNTHIHYPKHWPAVGKVTKTLTSNPLTATASSPPGFDETTSDQASSSPLEEDFSTTQPWMQPHSIRYEMERRRPIDTSTAFAGPFNTTPIVPLVTPYKPPKRGPLLLKDDDGRTVDLGMYTVCITPLFPLFCPTDIILDSSFFFHFCCHSILHRRCKKPGESCDRGLKKSAHYPSVEAKKLIGIGSDPPPRAGREREALRR